MEGGKELRHVFKTSVTNGERLKRRGTQKHMDSSEEMNRWRERAPQRHTEIDEHMAKRRKERERERERERY